MDGLSVGRMSTVQALAEKLTRTGVDCAIEVLHSVDLLHPMRVPERFRCSPQLATILADPAQRVPPDVRVEFDDYISARQRRTNATEENERRLRTLLWAEAKLRANKRDEWTLLRDFNRTYWGVAEPAGLECNEQDAQLTAALKRWNG